MGMNDSFVYNNERFVTGDKVICTIDRTEIIDAKIYVCSQEELENSEVINMDDIELSIIGAYICQNDLTGLESPNLLGYNKAWIFSIDLKNGEFTESVNNLKHLKYFCKDELVKIVQSAFPNT